MIIQLFLNKDKIIEDFAINVGENPIANPENYEIEVNENILVNIQRYRTKYIDNAFDFSKNDSTITKMNIRNFRKEFCFDIINRGQVWYNTLTENQKQELQTWYQSWLDAPETLIIPNKPEWL